MDTSIWDYSQDEQLCAKQLIQLITNTRRMAVE